jgi:hypothetical protein
MIAIVTLTSVYSPPMDHMKMVVVQLGCKKEDHVAEVWAPNTNNNVTHHANVDTVADHPVVEPVKNEHQHMFNNNINQTKYNNKIPLALIQMSSNHILQNNHIKYNKLAVPVQMIVMEIITIAYSPLMDPLTAAFAFLGNLKEELVVEAHLRCIKDNVILR